MAADPKFEYAHKNRDKIVWMSQNTNQIPTCSELEDALHEGIEKKVYNLYPLEAGHFGLPEAIKNDLGAPDDYEILLTNGGIEGEYITTRALLKPGDEVICSDPSFMPIHHQIRLSGAVPVEIPVYQEPWRMTPEQVQENITDKTKLILLIDPLNPLGSAYTGEDVKAICDIAEDHDLLILDDITYRDFNDEAVSTYEYVPDRTVVCFSFSKSYGLAGMRIGGVMAPPHHMKNIRHYNTNVLSVNVLSQWAALAGIKTKSKWLPQMKETLKKNQEIIKECVDGIEGAFLPLYPSKNNVFVIDISATGADPTEVERKMLFDHDVFIRDGKYVSPQFGHKFVRVSFSVPTEGVYRFAEAFPKVMAELSK